MVKDPLSLLDSLVVAISGFVIVFIMLAVLWGIIIVISRAVGGVAKTSPAPAAAAPAAAPAKAPVKEPEPELPLVPLVPEIDIGQGISEAQAACIMAIVCSETDIPLDQLIFRSIKEVK